MPKKLDDIFAREWGIRTNHELMENGERRFRLAAADGSSYIRCENPGKPVWENSHCHHTLKEMILVQSGSILYAEYRDREALYRYMEKDAFVVTTPDIPHNIYMLENAVVHTIKFGDCSQNDWIPSPELDVLTKGLSIQKINAIINKAK